MLLCVPRRGLPAFVCQFSFGVASAVDVRSDGDTAIGFVLPRCLDICQFKAGSATEILFALLAKGNEVCVDGVWERKSAAVGFSWAILDHHLDL